ncbi:MAG: 3-phosphoglycerate dehydrogenase [Tannerella sp.]|jgi:D-3-phosphoglycerate dehydrogenase|nr:3-phosphoglycerate dehydrogenase [Tannerella sp.]
MNVLLATEKPFAAPAVDAIRRTVEAAGMTLSRLEKYTAKAQLLDAVAGADAVIIRSDIIDGEVLDAARQLKIVVRAGAGYDNVDLASATAHRVCVMNTPGQNANAVAELALGLMVYGVRAFFSGAPGTELKGKKLGIHAYGNVGRHVARIAAGFGMETYAFDPFLPAGAIEKDGVTPLSSAPEMYAACRFVSLHIPATAETRDSIGYDLLASMPEGAMLVNTARREVVHEAGLLRVMTERPDFRYMTDVMPGIHAELTATCAGRYFSTPKKAGAQTAEANNNAGIAAAAQIVDFLLNGNEQFRVNPS